MSKIESYDDFVKVHGILLAASGLPPKLYPRLFQKLASDTLDGGAYFQIESSDDDRRRRLLLTSDSMPKDSDVFLVDHAWTFRLPDACKQLKEVPGLAERMASLMSVDIDVEAGEEEEEVAEELSVDQIIDNEIRYAADEGYDSLRWLELEGLGIVDDSLLSLHLPSQYQDFVALSLIGNKIESADVVIQEVTKFKNLKALWLNDNPVLQKSERQMAVEIRQGCPSLEIYNSCFTPNYGLWALGFCGDIFGKDNPGCVQQDQPLCNVTSLDLSNRSIHNLVNKAFHVHEMPKLSHLNIRGNPLDQNSVGELFEVLQLFPSLSSLEVDIPGPLGDNALEILEALSKLSLLNGVDTAKILENGKLVIDAMLQPRIPEPNPEDTRVDRILDAMWLYAMNYRLADEEKLDESSLWYVMDELGSALRHSDEPNFKVAPFLFMPSGKLESAVSYSVMWPRKSLQKGDECTRDFLSGIGEDKQRSARLTAWFQTPENYFIHEFEKYQQKLQAKAFDSLPSNPSISRSIRHSDGSPLLVYTDLPQVEEFLTRPEFVITNEPKDAHILWTSVQVDEELKKEVGITDDQYINQFPFEACLVMKHHLAETIQMGYGSPKWLQPTYNLETQLSQFIGDYCVRKRDQMNNLWILKPWNMARTIDTSITDNLSAIIRMMETGPKICQKYIEHPALFKGKKFDLRYIVLVRSINPLEIYLTEIFWVRLSNNPYSLEKHSFFEYETHFTVMNYGGRTLNHKPTAEFVREFEQEHNVKWMNIHEKVRQVIREVFEAAALTHPEMQSPKSRAIYGVDVMLDSSFEPKILEVTYCPDCMRACKYDMETMDGKGIVKGGDFFNYVFGCLFLDETAHVTPL
ncbi:PREDICTED: tubulin--tyrosine ligase-like protein 12 isoform X3 [Camelina sativa]|uniref:Tubulin--tyrosine ligase-like protein 12 isoform X3 n=1 Tax=Camelina sativa TaxID=90675 RepID=A0ABM0SVF0_CAMSA|nr:PREDICTED: tubulin--tyrosine ligase-like protein 12 isoform X3 [Camelina sativa]